MKARLEDKSDPFVISRWTSELIVQAWLRRLYAREMSPEEIASAQVKTGEIEAQHLDRLAVFERKQRDSPEQ